MVVSVNLWLFLDRENERERINDGDFGIWSIVNDGDFGIWSIVNDGDFGIWSIILLCKNIILINRMRK